MADYLTPPTIRKKKPDFWGGFATALAAEVKRRAALKDAMEQFKTQQDMTLAKQKDLAGFEQGLKSDYAILGQPQSQVTPSALDAIAQPEDVADIGIPEGGYGPPTKQAYDAGLQSNLGDIISRVRARTAQENQKAALQALRNQGSLQRQEMVGEQKSEADARKEAFERETAAQKHTYRMEEIAHRAALSKEAKDAGADPKLIAGALSARGRAYSATRSSYGTHAEATQAGDAAFDNYLTTYKDFGFEVPTRTGDTGKNDGVKIPGGTPADTDSTGIGAGQIGLRSELDKLEQVAREKQGTPEGKQAYETWLKKKQEYDRLYPGGQ